MYTAVFLAASTQYLLSTMLPTLDPETYNEQADPRHGSSPGSLVELPESRRARELPAVQRAQERGPSAPHSPSETCTMLSP